jgi:hypothetical protein
MNLRDIGESLILAQKKLNLYTLKNNNQNENLIDYLPLGRLIRCGANYVSGTKKMKDVKEISELQSPKTIINLLPQADNLQFMDKIDYI